MNTRRRRRQSNKSNSNGVQHESGGYEMKMNKRTHTHNDFVRRQKYGECDACTDRLDHISSKWQSMDGQEIYRNDFRLLSTMATLPMHTIEMRQRKRRRRKKKISPTDAKPDVAVEQNNNSQNNRKRYVFFFFSEFVCAVLWTRSSELPFIQRVRTTNSPFPK